MSNVIFINGWGDALTSFSIANLRNRTIAEFGRAIYAPPPVNYWDTSLMLRYLDKMKDIVIPVGLSCGCSTVNAVAKMRPNEQIPYAMLYSPSIRCGLPRVPKNIAKATQVTSNPWDFFNPGGYQIVLPEIGNKTSKIDVIQSGKAHGWSCDSPEAQKRLWQEIQSTLKK